LWYIYFLELSNGDFYVGHTHDLKQGSAAHEAGGVPSTKAFRPVALKSYVGVEDAERARKLERYFKTGSGKAVALKRFLR
jgi:putative endonuclease